MPAITPTLYTATACNFCQRARIAFAVKGVPVELVEIDLVKRPAWYRERASRGSVPLLECDDGAFFGSAVINEFVEERWPEPALLPRDAAARARARMWIEWWNREPTPAYEERLMNVRQEREAAVAARLDAALRDCEARLAAQGYAGGYWGGAQLGLVDASAAPVFVRFAGLRHFHGFEIPAELGRVRAWCDALLADPLVRATAPPEPELIAVLAAYREVLAKAARAGIEVKVSGGN